MNGIDQKRYVERTTAIRTLNDQFRRSLKGGRVYFAHEILNASDGCLDDLFATIAAFTAFDEANDPYHEHDFGSVLWNDMPIFWKIDYLDLDMINGSPDPTNPDITTRILTLMMAWEY